MSKFGNEVNKLIKGIKNGTVESEELYKLTYNHLEMVAFHYLLDKTYIEDIMCEAYLKIFAYINKANPNKNCYSWMCRIVQHVAYDFNRINHLTEEMDEIADVSLNADIEDYIAEKADLIKIIKDLSQEDQKMVYYRFFEDLSYGETANKLNLKKNYVFKRIRAILKIINKSLKDYGNE